MAVLGLKPQLYTWLIVLPGPGPCSPRGATHIMAHGVLGGRWGLEVAAGGWAGPGCAWSPSGALRPPPARVVHRVLLPALTPRMEDQLVDQRAALGTPRPLELVAWGPFLTMHPCPAPRDCQVWWVNTWRDWGPCGARNLGSSASAPQQCPGHVGPQASAARSPGGHCGLDLLLLPGGAPAWTCQWRHWAGPLWLSRGPGGPCRDSWRAAACRVSPGVLRVLTARGRTAFGARSPVFACPSGSRGSAPPALSAPLCPSHSCRDEHVPPESRLSSVCWFFGVGYGLGLVAVCVWEVRAKRDRDHLCRQAQAVVHCVQPEWTGLSRCHQTGAHMGVSVRALGQGSPWQQTPQEAFPP